ncbi:MAG TPA: 50S ribosomal protein L5 [Candidatus Saccharimonadales bacterium]|nr:50S ribosomal protein L5 [Candidatus Saccharimonadales bacterium]
MTNTINIVDKYKKEVMPKLKEEFSLKNDMAVPYIEKIVLNMGLAEASSSKDVLEKATDQLATIAGQKPRITTAKKAISSFKLREGDKIGLMVTLRDKKAWSFMQKFVAIVMPRMRDFRGLNETKFDKAGNYSIGITEQILFPEIDYSKIDKIRGLVISFVIKKSDPAKSKRFMELLGVPFRKA